VRTHYCACCTRPRLPMRTRTPITWSSFPACGDSEPRSQSHTCSGNSRLGFLEGRTDYPCCDNSLERFVVFGNVGTVNLICLNYIQNLFCLRLNNANMLRIIDKSLTLNDFKYYQLKLLMPYFVIVNLVKCISNAYS